MEAIRKGAMGRVNVKCLTSLTLGDGSATEAFLYDANGNMTYDGNTGVGIEYNELNLPCRIFDGTNDIRYIYNASGEKLASATGSSLTYYRSVMIYTQSDGGAEQLAHMLQPEGLVQFNGASAEDSYTYMYFKTDHLGSTRAVLAAVWNEASNGYAMNVEQATDYYPFGLAHELNDLGVNRYLFSGKELQDVSLGSLGLLGMYDFGSRYYNPYLGRWFGIDPALQLTNPYIYCGNNPMMFVDPDGEFFFSLFIPILGPILDAACWGATIGAASYTMSVAFSPGGFNNWSWGQFGKSAGIGALQGIATMGVGEIFGQTGNFLREAGRGLSHGIVSGGSSALSGGDFLSGFASGALGSWAGHGANALGLTNTVAGALAYSSVAAGIGAWAAGGSFLQGAANGLMVGFLNQVLHDINYNNKIKPGMEWKEGMPTIIPYKGHRVLVVDMETNKYIDVENSILNQKAVDARLAKYPGRKEIGSHMSQVAKFRVSEVVEGMVMTQQPPVVGMLGGQSFLESINPFNFATRNGMNNFHLKLFNAQYHQAQYYQNLGIIR